MLVSTSCKTTKHEQIDESDAREAIASMLPSAPEIPNFPTLHWSYNEGLYSITETDADLLLDYMENTLPAFAFDFKAWQKQVYIVIKSLL